ncbi:hypothetical protein FQZ97_1088690 [compost metagenome]
MPREVEVVGAAGILQGHAHRVFAGVLAGGDRGNVDADELADVPGQRRGRAGADFLGDGEQRMAVDGGHQAGLGYALEGGEQGCHPGLVVQVAGTDMAALGELRQGVEGDEVADGNAQAFAVGAGGAVGVQAQFDVVPTDRQAVHLGVEGVTRGQ